MNETPTAKDWQEFLALLRTVDVPDDFIAERPLNVVPPERGTFDDEVPQSPPSRAH